jgi:hypothetical protein
MGAQATRLSDVKVKAAKPREKDYISQMATAFK